MESMKVQGNSDIRTCPRDCNNCRYVNMPKCPEERRKEIVEKGS